MVAPRRNFRLMAPVVPEVDLHASIADALDTLLLPGTVWTSLPIGHVRLDPAQAARLARIGVHRGWFDILVVHAGRPIGLEVKRQGGRLSRDRVVPTRRGGTRVLEGQTSVFPRLLEAGIAIAAVESVDEALAALAAFGVPLRRFT